EFVDLEWLKEEFITVTRNELDFAAEGKNTERFIQDFAHDPQISAPQILWDYTAPHVITLEDVSYFRIDDFAALDAAGINRTEVSKKLFNNYLEQFFITNMVHADPHAGNLFVKPLPTEEETAAGRAHFLPDEPVPHVKDRPFQIVFIDFGMTVIVPERLRAGLKDYVIGVGTRDAARVVRSYVDTGSLLPNADLDAIEQMTEDQFTQFWGAMMGQMQGVDLDSYNRFFNRDYREVIYSNKFQFQMDMLFVMRAMGILSGMATKLDPGFNPMNHIVPFAQQMAQQDITQNWEAWLKQAVDFTQIFFKVPIDLRETLSKVHQGKFVIQTKLTPTTQKSLNQINTSLNRLLWAIVMIGLLLVAAVWYVGNLIATALQQLG
ncbi:MAG: AarF/UbiB family protein, partial [Chloroflexota bacterium]